MYILNLGDEIMCIAAPAQVVEINREENWLFADFGGARKKSVD